MSVCVSLCVCVRICLCMLQTVCVCVCLSVSVSVCVSMCNCVCRSECLGVCLRGYVCVTELRFKANLTVMAENCKSPASMKPRFCYKHTHIRMHKKKNCIMKIIHYEFL